MPKTPTPQPIEIPFFSTGMFTYRSQLYSPFRALGVNIVSYHDAVLDGADFELTDLMQWAQRPGFTQFCQEQLAAEEVINQFYSARALDGTLLTMFDSNQRLATFNPTNITTIFSKSTPQQGFVNQVGDTTYFYDGVDAVRYDQIYGLGPNGIAAPTGTPTVSATGGWLANTPYSSGSVLLDYNGNVEYLNPIVATTMSASGQAFDIALNSAYWVKNHGGIIDSVGTGTPPTTAFVANDLGFSVPAGATILGVQVSFQAGMLAGSDVNLGQIELFYAGANIGSPITPGTALTTGLPPYVFGSATNLWGTTLTPAIINDPTFGFCLSCDITSGTAELNAPFQVFVYYSVGSQGVSGGVLPVWSALPGSTTADGSLKWANLGVVGQWLPGVAYTIPSVILDSNNNLQMLTSVGSVTPYSGSASYASGDIVTYGGTNWTAQGGFSGIPPNANVASSTLSGGTTTYVYNWLETPNPVTSGIDNPEWALTVGATTNDGSVVWTNIGPGTIIVAAGYEWGVCYRTMDGHLSTMGNSTTNTGPLLGGSPIVQSAISGFSITSDVVTFLANQTYTPGESVYVEGMSIGTYLNDNVFEVGISTPSASFTITNIAIAANVVTIQIDSNYPYVPVAGQDITVTAVTGATFLNGATLTVSSTGLSPTQFEAPYTYSGSFGPTADTGTVISVGAFTAAFAHADVAETADTGTVTPIIGQVSGNGITDSRLNYSANISNVTVSGNLVTIECVNDFFPGNTVLILGLSQAAFLNGYTLLLETATPNYITAELPFTHADYPSTPDVGAAFFCGIEVYRTADGGGIWYQVGALLNPEEAGATWTYTDTSPDSLLDEQLVAPLAHQNDPPPGQIGSIAAPFAGGTICGYWKGRQWLAQGQYLYFDAGQDCLNGDPHQSWPPGNRFEYPGPILGLAALETGLVVLGSDYFGVALGGPQTLAFYPDVIMKNFGVNSPNCVYQDGQALHLLTTQGQLFSISGGDKENEGYYISDFLASNFPPGNSYVTVHRNGNDAGLFVANGSTTVLRHGINIGTWSVPYYPVNGVGAMASIETGNAFSLGPNGAQSAVDTDITGVTWANPANVLSNTGIYATAALTGEENLTASAVTLYRTGTLGFYRYFTSVTFTTPAPAVGSLYTFAGFTTATELNGETLQSISSSKVPPLTEYQALFNGEWSPTLGTISDSGTAVVSGVTLSTDALDVTQFDFGVPSANTPQGIEVILNAYTSTAATLTVQMLKAGTPVGYAQTVNLPTGVTTLTFGDFNDLFGASWVYSDFVPANFGVRITAAASSAATVYVGYTTIKVYLTPNQVGAYSLCVAPTTPAGFIMARDLDSWEDAGGQYTSAFASDGCGITLGSITLSSPGQPLFPLQHVIVYADAAGVDGLIDQPEVAILPNEISGVTGLGFIPIPPDQVVPEPPPPAALESTTLQQLRYPVNMINSLASQWMHHLQVKITFPSSNAPHTIKALALKPDQE